MKDHKLIAVTKERIRLLKEADQSAKQAYEQAAAERVRALAELEEKLKKFESEG